MHRIPRHDAGTSALHCGMATGINSLMLEDCVLREEAQPAALAVDSARDRSRFQLD